MASFAALQGMRTAPRDPTNPRYPLNNFATFRSTNPFEVRPAAAALASPPARPPDACSHTTMGARGVRLGGRQVTGTAPAQPPGSGAGPRTESSPADWGTHKPAHEEVRRSTTPRIRQRAYGDEGAGTENEADRRARKQAHDDAVAKQERLVKELEELRGTVKRMQREPLRESVDDAFFDRLQTLKRVRGARPGPPPTPGAGGGELPPGGWGWGSRRAVRLPPSPPACRPTQEHERNLRVIERLYREKREAERRAEGATRTQGRPTTAPPRRHHSGRQDAAARRPSSSRGGGRRGGSRAKGAAAAPEDEEDEEEDEDDDLFASGPAAGDESAPPPAPLEGVEGEDEDEEDVLQGTRDRGSWSESVRHEMGLGRGRSARTPQRGRTASPKRGRAASPRGRTASSTASGRWASAARRRVQTKPFLSMEVGSGRSGGESITARKLREYLEEVRSQEEAHLKTQFRARDVPSSTTEPRFEMMRQQQRARSEEVKQLREKQLKESERPFRGMQERERAMLEKRRAREQARRAQEEEEQAQAKFRANPIPPEVQKATREAEEVRERARRERIEARKAALLSEARLPPRMEVWEKSRKAASKGGRGARKQGAGAAKPKPKPVPDFERLHGHWDEKLRQSRKSARRTTPQAFSFDRNDSGRKKEEEARLKAREERERRRMEDAERRRRAEEARRPKPAPLQADPAPTRAMSLREQQTTKVLEERRRREEAEAAAAERRRQQQEEANRRVAPTVRAMHEQYLEEFKSGREYVALEDVATTADGRASGKAQERAREAERRTREAARRLQDSLRQSKEKAPSLLERFRVDAAKQQARQTGVQRVASAMHAHKAARHLAGKVRQRKDDVFDDGDKAVLDMLSASVGQGAGGSGGGSGDREEEMEGGDVPDYLK